MQNKSFLELCQSGTPVEVRQAIKNKANLEEGDQIDRTGLMLAVLYNPDIEVARVLVEAGAPVDTLDVSDMSALHYAVEYSRCPELVELLLKAGSDANTISMYNRSVLMSAAAFNHHAVQLLLAFGADSKAVDEKNIDAVMYNIYFNYDKDVVACLFKAGSNPGHRDDLGRDWNDYLRIFVTNASGSGQKDLAPKRVDLVPALTLSEAEAERKAAWGVNPLGEPYWVERRNGEGTYTIHYQADGVKVDVPISDLPLDIDLCIPFHFPFSWILASCGEAGFFPDVSKPNFFIVDSSGKKISSFFAGNAIVSIIPNESSFWILYDEELEWLGNDAWLVEWHSSGKVLQVFNHENNDKCSNCVSVCKDGENLYAMFGPGLNLIKSNEKDSNLECHQSFSVMEISGERALMKDSFHIDNVLYEYSITDTGLVLKKRLALYFEDKPVWDYNSGIIVDRLVIDDGFSLFNIRN